MGFFDWLFTFIKGNPSGNIPSPRNKIAWQDIHYDKDKKQLIVDNIESEVLITTVQNTNSMEPSLDVGHIIVMSNNPKYLDDLNIGDIVIYEQGKIIIHSISEIRQDGTYRTQGWNIPRKDSQIIRKENIKWVALGEFWCKGEGYYEAGGND